MLVAFLFRSDYPLPLANANLPLAICVARWTRRSGRSAVLRQALNRMAVERWATRPPRDVTRSEVNEPGSPEDSSR